jgi:predicted MFS family arabinose efflux permease
MVLAVGFLVMFVGSGARFAFGLTLKPMADEFVLGRGLLGTTVAVYYFVTAVCMFLAGRFIDRYEARNVLAIGLLVSAAGIGLIALASEPWHLFALYGFVFAVGNGIASITPVSILVTRLYPQRAGAANGIISAGMSAGQLFMIAAMAFVLVASGWRPVYVWMGLAHLALLPLLLAIPRARSATGMAMGAGDAPAREGLTFPEAMRTRRFWLLLGIYGICGLGDFFVSTHLVAFAQDKGVNTLLAGNLLALMGLTALAGALWSGNAYDRHGLVWPLLTCFALRIGSLALLSLSHSTIAVTAFTLLFGLTFLMTAPLTVIAVRNAFGTAQLGTITGFIIMIHHACGGLGAWLGGVLFDAQGHYGTAFVLMLALSILAAWLITELRHERTS